LFDIGNTHITIGAFENERLISSWRIATRVEGTADEYAVLLKSLLRQRAANGIPYDGSAIASSVPPLIPTFQELCEKHLGLKPLVVGPGVKTGVKIRTDNPREVGADRVANALAVKRLYGTPAIVIDFGTPTIFDALSAEGDFLGTAIAPGIGISAEALFRATAQLPRVEIVAPATKSAIGKNTINSIQAGLIYGYVSLVEGMIARLKKELGENARVIATGEQVWLIAPETRLFDAVDETLTLQGIRMIYELNAGG
jgi:type III pantothenate kinase